MPLSTSPPNTASSSASADFYFNGFTKTFFEIQTETTQEKTVNISIPFPKKNDNLTVFLKSAEGLQFKEVMTGLLIKIKILFNKPSFDEDKLFEKLINNQTTVDQVDLDCLHFFAGILELVQDEMIAEDQRKKSIEDLFDEKSDRTSIKNNYFNLVNILVKHAVDVLKTWADKRKVSYSDSSLSYFIEKFNEEISDNNRDLFIAGVKLLRSIASLAENNKISPAKEFVIASFIQSLGVCAPGVYTHLQDTQLQLNIDIATEFTSYRRALAEDIANEILFKRYRYRNVGMDIHVVNTVINFNAETLGLLAIPDPYSDSCAQKASEMQEAFIVEFKKKLTPRHLIDITVDKLLGSLHDYIKLLNGATSGEALGEIQKTISILLFDSYGEDKKTFGERSLFDNTVLEKSEYKKYVLSKDIRDILVVTLTRRLINSGYLEATEIETIEHEKVVFYHTRSFPESSFFISKSNEANGLLDSVSALVKEVSSIPQKIHKILLEGFIRRVIVAHPEVVGGRDDPSWLNQLIEAHVFEEENLLKILIQENKWGWSLSMSIAYHQDPTTITSYFSWLRQLVETRMLEKEDLLKVLMRQTEDRWSLSLFVVRHQDATTITRYFSWLRQLVETRMLEKEDLLKILTEQNQQGHHLALIITQTRDAAITTSYLSWLRQLIEAHILEKEDLLKMLTEQDKNGWNLSMSIAKYQDAAVIASYLSWLRQLVETRMLEKEDLLKILTEQNQQGHHLALIITQTRDAAITTSYLSWLRQLIEAHILEKEDLLKMLTEQDKNGWNLSMSIAKYQDAATTASHLSWLRQLIEARTLEKKDLLKMLVQQTQMKTTFTFLILVIAQTRDVVVTISYLSLLRQLIETRIPEKEDLLEILTKQDQFGWNLGMGIARHQNATTMTSYLFWLRQLIEAHVFEKEDLLKILMQQDQKGGVLGMIIAEYQGDEVLITYLSWLNQLVEIHVLGKEDLLKILNQHDKEGWTLGMRIVSYEDSVKTKPSRRALLQHPELASVTTYLFLLEKLIEEPYALKKEDLLEMLTQQNRDGWTFGMLIAEHRDVETIAFYLSFLRKLIEIQWLEKEDLLRILNKQNHCGNNFDIIMWRHYYTAFQHKHRALIPRAEELESEREKIQKEQGLSLQEAKLWLRHKRAFQEQLSKIKDSTPLSCDDICRVTELSEEQANEFDQKTKLLQAMLKIDVLSAACLESESKFEFRNKIISFLEEGADRYHYRISEKARLYEYAAQSRRAKSESTFFESETTRFFKNIAQKDRESEKLISQQQPVSHSGHL